MHENKFFSLLSEERNSTEEGGSPHYEQVSWPRHRQLHAEFNEHRPSDQNQLLRLQRVQEDEAMTVDAESPITDTQARDEAAGQRELTTRQPNSL